MDFLQEIVLIIYLELIKFLAHTFRGHISWIQNSLEEISHDDVPLR